MLLLLLFLPGLTGCFRSNSVQGFIYISSDTVTSLSPDSATDSALNGVHTLQPAAKAAPGVSTDFVDPFRAGDSSLSVNPSDSAEWEITNELVVLFREQDRGRTADTIRPLKGKVKRTMLRGRIAVLQFPDKDKVTQARKELKKRPDIISIEPNYRVQALGDSPVPGNVASSSNTVGISEVLWNHQKIRLPEAQALLAGREAPVIAVLDTGFLLTHPNLAAAWTAARWDFVDNDYDPSIQDPSDPKSTHGTHVAGIIGARLITGSQAVGVLPTARLMPVRVLDDKGSGTLDDIAAGIEWAVNQGARVINLSLGAKITSHTATDQVIAYAVSQGVIIVAAAGNLGDQPDNQVTYPARHSSVIAVAATDAADLWAIFSSYGPQVEVSAPGTEYYSNTAKRGILSTIVNANGTAGYGYMSGTSMACPHVSALAAMLYTVHPAGPEEIRRWLQGASVDLGKTGHDYEFGHGRVNALTTLGLPLTRITLEPADSSGQAALHSNPAYNGSFTLPKVLDGRWALSAWIDTNRDGVINAGDYHGIYPYTITVPGTNRYRDVILAPVH